MPKLLVVLQIFQPNTIVQMYKWCMSRYPISNVQATFEGMIKETILAETIFQGWFKTNFDEGLGYVQPSCNARFDIFSDFPPPL